MGFRLGLGQVTLRSEWPTKTTGCQPAVPNLERGKHCYVSSHARKLAEIPQMPLLLMNHCSERQMGTWLHLFIYCCSRSKLYSVNSVSCVEEGYSYVEMRCIVVLHRAVATRWRRVVDQTRPTASQKCSTHPILAGRDLKSRDSRPCWW